MKRLNVQGKPHLCLFAIEDIQAGTEITSDYGDLQWPWRVLVSKNSLLNMLLIKSCLKLRFFSLFHSSTYKYFTLVLGLEFKLTTGKVSPCTHVLST